MQKCISNNVQNYQWFIKKSISKTDIRKEPKDVKSSNKFSGFGQNYLQKTQIVALFFVPRNCHYLKSWQSNDYSTKLWVLDIKYFQSEWPPKIQMLFTMYRIGVFFWILLGLVWLGGVISIATEMFRSSRVAKNSQRGIVNTKKRIRKFASKNASVRNKLVDNYKTQQNTSNSKLKIINNNLQCWILYSLTYQRETLKVKSCARCGTRTHDRWIKSPTLYRLS